MTLSTILDGSFPFELLREALLRAIHDIDALFSKVSFIYATEDLIYLFLAFAHVAVWSMKDASRYNLNSGTTAAVVLLADAQILVANLGDSKAFLCSEGYQSPSEAKGQTIFAFTKIFYFTLPSISRILLLHWGFVTYCSYYKQKLWPTVF